MKRIERIREHERRAIARIYTLRRYRDLTQKQLADAVGMTRGALAAMEEGDRNLRLGEAVAICEVLQVDLAALVSPEPLNIEVPIT